MHMADALISPAVGGTCWAISAGVIAHCVRKARSAARENLTPLMGVLGAFIFAVQMINVTIPGTGSSGHLSGGLMLAILLGPCAGFLVMASVLTVQALFFADGGLLALGCNILNLGFFSAFIVYPLLYRPMTRGGHSATRAWWAAMVASILALQLGALGVVFETVISGVTNLSFSAFALLMQPIHLAIGVVEGLATAVVVAFVARARPTTFAQIESPHSMRTVYVSLIVMAVLIGGGLSWFASTHPDGLEWSLERITGEGEIVAPERAPYKQIAELQGRTALLPDYDFKTTGAAAEAVGDEAAETWPAVKGGTTVSGLVGGALTMSLVLGVGLLVRGRAAPHAQNAS